MGVNFVGATLVVALWLKINDFVPQVSDARGQPQGLPLHDCEIFLDWSALLFCIPTGNGLLTYFFSTQSTQSSTECHRVKTKAFF
jgi:hypothetical protein